MRWEISYKEKKGKNTNTWRLNNTLLHNQEITEEIKEEIKNYLETITTKHDNPKPMGCSKIRSKREVYSNTSLPQETRKISYKLFNLTHKGTRKRRTNKTQSLEKVCSFEPIIS